MREVGSDQSQLGAAQRVKDPRPSESSHGKASSIERRIDEHGCTVIQPLHVAGGT